MASLQTIQLFILFLCFVKKSDQTCRNASYPYDIICDSLEDLYGNNSLGKRMELSQTNGFKTLQLVPYERAKNIEELTTYGPINGLLKGSMKNFTKLKDLRLRSSKIEIIHKEILENPNLEFLLIQRCEVKTIENEAFSNLPNLKTLIIENNNLTQIQKNIFNNLGISSLSLSNNQISEIEKYAFANLSNLEFLNLHNNNLTEFNIPDFVTNLSKLKLIWLYENNISEVTNYMLKGLSNLTFLNLAFNRISRIENKTFEQTPNLQVLVLSYNFLKVIDGAVLPTMGLQKLHTLLLDHNRLMYLSLNFLFRLNSLTGLNIGGNPWSCPCLDLILRWSNDINVHFVGCDWKFFNGKKPICVVPNRKRDVCVYKYNEKK